MIDFIENVCQAGCQKALYCKTYARFQVTLWATEIKKISLVSRSWSTVWINMQKMSNGDYFDEKMRRGDRSKEARRISPPLKLLLKSPKLRGSTAPKSAHLHRGREQGVVFVDWTLFERKYPSKCPKSVIDLQLFLQREREIILSKKLP